METMINVWAVVEHVRVASGAAELAIFTAILYWFFTSSRVADMLEVVGERVGGWCGRDSSGSLRQAVRARRRHQNDVYTKIDVEKTTRASSLYRVKEAPTVPAPQPEVRPQTGLACSRCAPASRESWQDAKCSDTGAVINVLDIGRQTFANGGVVSRYLCDLAQCCHLISYDYKDVVPKVVEDENFQRAIERTTREELRKSGTEAGGGDGGNSKDYTAVRKKVEAKAMKVLLDISSALSNNILKVVAWLCHKAVRRVAREGCGTHAASAARLRRARAAGLPLVFVPLHRSHADYILVTFALYLTGLRPPLVAAGDNMRIPLFGWILRACGAFYIRRRADGSENNGDIVYKTALREYILKSLAAENNIEFFIEGGRTRTGKPQPPKAGILSVIMDAYLDGTIEDALLVPVTLNYDRLVDGNFVREQLGMPKQMETFWSALRGIWRTMNTNHGSIRVDFNQPISLKEMVTSFQKYKFLQAPIEKCLSPPNNNNLAVNLDRKILYNNSHSSLYGDDVSAQHKVMVEAIGRHLVYDATVSTPLMCTNVMSYVLLTSARAGAARAVLTRRLALRARRLRTAGKQLGYSGSPAHVLQHACDMLGRSLVRSEGSGEKDMVYPQLSIAGALELSYYANAVSVHYAPAAILATALECVVSAEGEGDEVRHEVLVQSALRLSEVMCCEYILCPPCHTIDETMLQALDTLIEDAIISRIQTSDGLEEQRWSRRYAEELDEEDECRDRTTNLKYKINNTPDALDERRRLVLTIRPVLEAYSATCRAVTAAADSQQTTLSQKTLVKQTLDSMIQDFTQNKMIYGEAVSSDAIQNCLKLLRQWGVLELSTVNRERRLKLLPPYDNQDTLHTVCTNIYKYNMDTPLLKEA